MFEERQGWLERTEEWRRAQADTPFRENPFSLLLRPPLGTINAFAAIVAAAGWVWDIASDGFDGAPLAVVVVFLAAHVTILATIVVEVGARIVVRRRRRRDADGF